MSHELTRITINNSTTQRLLSNQATHYSRECTLITLHNTFISARRNILNINTVNVKLPFTINSLGPGKNRCIIELGNYWFRQWLAVYSVPSKYLKQHWHILKTWHWVMNLISDFCHVLNIVLLAKNMSWNVETTGPFLKLETILTAVTTFNFIFNKFIFHSQQTIFSIFLTDLNLLFHIY